ncbi:hypothetical protein JCM11641_008233 [Rhodosporidiobolus odoratus]
MPSSTILPIPMSQSSSTFFPPSHSRSAHFSDLLPPRPPASSSSTATSSSFFARMHHFPLFSSNWGAKDTEAAAASRDRRFSIGGVKVKSKAEKTAPPGASSGLKRSMSARTSLIATAKKLSTQKRPRDFPPISRPVLAERNGLEDQPSSFMRDYRDRAPVFAMSSPELATPGEEKSEWAAFSAGDEGSQRQAALPHSPMVKWDASADKDGRSSFVPLSPRSVRPFSASSSTPSGESLHHLSEPSTASSAGPDTPELSSSPVGPVPLLRARSPKARWKPPILPSALTPPVATPTEPLRRTLSRSPPLNDDEREAARAEALAKLISPTPTSSKFPDYLASFPFPAVNLPPEPALSAPPPRPTRPLPKLPSSTTTTSLILPLPSARSCIFPDDEPSTTPPVLTRSNTVGLHPSPVPLDIDFKGKLVRARNSQPVTASPSFTISSSSSFGLGSSPGSSRFSEWGRPVNSRKSSETSLSTSVGMHERDELPLPKGGLYALASDRRLVESAVDVLAIVEEDEAPLSPAPALRAKRSPSKPSSSPSRRPSTSRKRISLESPLSNATSSDVLVVPRSRARPPSASPPVSSPGKIPRPYRLSMSDRSHSSGIVVEPTRNEREEHGLPSSSSTIVPFPSGLSRAASPPRASPQRPRAGKRCISELHAEERPLSSDREKLYGLGLGLPSSMGSGGVVGGGRTRHESLGLDGEEVQVSDFRQRRASRRVSSGAATRTKLVLREKGLPTLTYQLGECIGRGQFGSVYRALNLNTGQVVAVKRIQLEGKTDSEIQELSKEVTLLQRLAHPSVVKYEGVVRTEHYLNIILEYVENGSLQGTLKQFGQLPESLVASFVVKILEGLAYLHMQGVVHCDLKAANILSTKNGNIKLSDFGVSLNLHAIKATKGVSAGAGEANGTPNWMAPEVIELQGATAASDIWSLGATICELIDGKPPYADLVAMSAMFRIVEDEMPPIPARSSEELRAFLTRCFRKDPKERPAAEELFEDPWLLKHWNPQKDMRPQDSLPFLRRLSTDYRRPTINVGLSLEPLADEEVSFTASPSPLRPPPLPFAQEQARGRESIDSGYRASGELIRSPEPSMMMQAVEEVPRPHNFVKTTFSQVIECKICGDYTKRHAVLCSSCGLISHARCKEFAPSCDLRAQLLGHHHFPLAPTLSIASSQMQPSPSTFALADYLPFSKNRRPKVTPTSSSDSHMLLSPVAPTQSRATGAIRQLSNALLPSSVSKTRTPEHTPPSSFGKSARPVVGGRVGNASESSLSAAEDQQRRASLDVPTGPQALRHKLSGARVLAKKKSHGRTTSQPVNGVMGKEKGGKGWLPFLS